MGKGGVQLQAPGTRTPGSAFEDRGPPNLCHRAHTPTPTPTPAPTRPRGDALRLLQDRWDGVGRMDRVRVEDWGMPAVLGTLFTLPPTPHCGSGRCCRVEIALVPAGVDPSLQKPQTLSPYPAPLFLVGDVPSSPAGAGAERGSFLEVEVCVCKLVFFFFFLHFPAKAVWHLCLRTEGVLGRGKEERAM